MAKKPIKENKRIAVNQLVSCKDFKKGIPKSDDVFVFPLPCPMRVGIGANGQEMIATHCVLQKQDDGSVINRFCFINDKGQICLINFSDQAIQEDEPQGYSGKSRSREIIN